MKSTNEVYEMLQEAKSKHEEATKRLNNSYGGEIWYENVALKRIAEAEVEVLRSILGSDEVRLNLEN